MFVAAQKNEFKQRIKSQLKPSFPPVHISFLVSTVMSNEYTHLQSYGTDQTTWLRLLSIGRSLETLGDTSRFAYISSFNGWYGGLKNLFLDVLLEWLSSREEAVDTPSIYASASLFSLRHISFHCRYVIGKTPRSLHYLRMRTHNPAQPRWYRRRFFIPNNMMYKKIIYSLLLPYDGVDQRELVDAVLGNKEYEHIKRVRSSFFSFTIRMLLIFLEKSGYSEELIGYIIHNRYYYPGIIHRILNARQKSIHKAIKTYRKRMEGRRTI